MPRSNVDEKRGKREKARKKKTSSCFKFLKKNAVEHIKQTKHVQLTVHYKKTHIQLKRTHTNIHVKYEYFSNGKTFGI